ncbi:MAG: hypothetical protein M1818_002105 [Claussenomyces sp. TS43310]|nr:MAG: hypothetical protein M1818_002105 [Claussenomyces sp. TS43310]
MSAKPKISLKIGSGGFSATSPPISTPTPSTAGPKIRLSMGGASKPSTPSEPGTRPVVPAQKTKAGRIPKPSAKVAARKSNKRTKDEYGDDAGANGNATALERAAKKIRLSVGGPKTPTVLKAKFKGKPPKRPLGEGYDSEASDREEDPVIEEEWVLRMLPGEDCTYLRQMMEERRIGIPKQQGGADVHFKFLHPDGRRAVITIKGRHYAATLVDLPCVIEGMKSWDKKGWYKAADICQMLLVFAQIPRESDALTIELPKSIDPHTHQYPHGLTPPMYFARKRRFRKRISRTAIEAVEDAVEKLLEADAKAVSTRYEMIEPEPTSRQASFASPGAYGQEDAEEYSPDEDADADGEADDSNHYFSQIMSNGAGNAEEEDDLNNELAADLEADLMADFEAELGVDAATPLSNAIVETPSQILDTGTPGDSLQVDEDSGDESLEDDEEDAEGEEDDGIDEDERDRLAQLQGAREDIMEMEKQLASLQAQAAVQSNPILGKRIKANIEKVKAELQLKKSAIGEGDENGD